MLLLSPVLEIKIMRTREAMLFLHNVLGGAWIRNLHCRLKQF